MWAPVWDIEKEDCLHWETFWYGWDYFMDFHNFFFFFFVISFNKVGYFLFMDYKKKWLCCWNATFSSTIWYGIFLIIKIQKWWWWSQCHYIWFYVLRFEVSVEPLSPRRGRFFGSNLFFLIKLSTIPWFNLIREYNSSTKPFYFVLSFSSFQKSICKTTFFLL